MTDETKLWRYNRTTGYWVYERSCLMETAEEWLSVFRKSNPAEFFKLGKKKPVGAPK